MLRRPVRIEGYGQMRISSFSQFSHSRYVMLFCLGSC